MKNETKRVFDQGMKTESSNDIRRPFNAEDMKKKIFSEEILSMMRKDDKNVIDASFGKPVKCEVQPGEEMKTIFTTGLGGCFGVVLLVEKPSGAREVIMHHFPPVVTRISLKQLDKQLDPSWEEEGVKKTALVFAAQPFGGVPNPQLSPYLDSLRSRLGEDANINEQMYPAASISHNKDQGCLVVTVPPTGQGAVHYKGWGGEFEGDL